MKFIGSRSFLFRFLMVLLAGYLAPSHQALAQDKPEIVITIKKGKTIMSEEKARSDNPWLEVSDDETAVIAINKEIHTLRGPFYGRLQKAIESQALTISNAEKARLITEQVKSEKRGLTLFPNGLPSFGFGAAKSDSAGSPSPQTPLTLSDLNIDRDGGHCLGLGSLRLVRLDAGQRIEIILGKIGGVSRRLVFEKSSHTASWPQGIEPKEDEEWFIAQPDSNMATISIRFRNLSPYENVSVETLIGQGCEAQARLAAQMAIMTQSKP